MVFHESVPGEPDVTFTPSPKLEEAVTVGAAEKAAQKEAEQGYRIGRWAGMPNHECLVCPFSSLDPMSIDLHVAEHRRPVWGVPPLRATGLVDENGQPILRPATEED